MRSLAVAVCSKLLTWAMSPELLHRAALVGWGGHRWRSGRGKIAPAAHLEAGLRQQRGTEKGLSRSEVAEIERIGKLRRFLAPQLADLIVARGDETLDHYSGDGIMGGKCRGEQQTR